MFYVHVSNHSFLIMLTTKNNVRFNGNLDRWEANAAKIEKKNTLIIILFDALFHFIIKILNYKAIISNSAK